MALNNLNNEAHIMVSRQTLERVLGHEIDPDVWYGFLDTMEQQVQTQTAELLEFYIARTTEVV